MFVKDNQPGLLADIQLLFNRIEGCSSSLRPINCLASQRIQAVGESGSGSTVRSVSTSEVGHGRIEKRDLRVTIVPRWAHWLDWPGAEQVFEIKRNRRFKRSGKTQHEIVYGITSLNEKQASAKSLLELCRGHWSIENRSHWVRDVTFDEDRSIVRSGSIPQVMAALRNTAIGLMRLAGHKNLAAATRTHAAQTHRVIALLHESPTFE